MIGYRPEALHTYIRGRHAIEIENVMEEIFGCDPKHKNSQVLGHYCDVRKELEICNWL